MGIISWIVLGGVAGWVADRFVSRSSSMGLVANIFVGIFGAIVGGFLANLVARNNAIGFNLGSFFCGCVGGCGFFGHSRRCTQLTK